MRTITKQAPPQELTDWVAEMISANERADYALGIPNADALRIAALAEQQGLCAYTGRTVEACTLEHIKPYSICKREWVPDNLAGEDVQWPNLVATHKTYGEPLFGESVRKDWYDSDYISPLEQGCADHFDFNLHGEINGTDSRGRAMVANLQLDARRLVEERQAAVFEACSTFYAFPHGTISLHDFILRVTTAVAGKLPSFVFVLERALPKLQ